MATDLTDVGFLKCQGCHHESALHRHSGPCRINGCPCASFVSPYRARDAREPATPPVVAHRRRFAWRSALAGGVAGAIAGLVFSALLALVR